MFVKTLTEVIVMQENKVWVGNVLRNGDSAFRKLVVNTDNMKERF